MELKELKEELKKVQIKLIKDVLYGKSLEEEIPFMRPDTIIELIGEITGENDIREDFEITGEKDIREDFDSNGWQMDYWLYIRVLGKQYEASGDGYYNEHCTFMISENEEEEEGVIPFTD